MKKSIVTKILSIVLAATTIFSTGALCMSASAASSDTIVVVLNDGTSTRRYTTANLNLRSSASTSSKVKAVLPKGLPVYVQKTSGNWCYVTAYPKGDCYKGWVSKSYLTECNTLGAYRVEATAGLNVRASASSTAKKLGALKYNTKVTVFGISGDWAMIKYNGRTAYVALKYLRCVA